MENKDIKANTPSIIASKVNTDKWIRSYLLLWSGILQLTEGEFNLLYELVKEYNSLKSTISSDNQRFEMLFSTKTRGRIRTKLDISESLFNNRIHSLKSKDVIINKDNMLSLNNKVLPVKELTFKFYIEDKQ